MDRIDIMDYRSPEIRSGLYVVATPIGTASDISLRALDLISNVSVLVAEDKRTLLKLMKIHRIKLEGRILLSYNDHNAHEQRPIILNILNDQKSVVLVSDSGTPLISDPGYKLVSEALSNGVYVSGAPGASAVLTALMISGLPTDKFFFGGFIPSKIAAKKEFFKKYMFLPATLVFYESAARLSKTLIDLCACCNINRRVVVCRELTKKFEEVQRGTLKEISDYFSLKKKIKGEIVLLVSRPDEEVVGDDQIDHILINAMECMSLKDAVDFTAKHLNISKKIVYAEALRIKTKT